MTTNEYGLDVSYFENKLKRILSEIDRYTPDELARECARMSTAIDKTVVLESEFQSTDTLNKLTGFAKVVGMNEFKAELIKSVNPLLKPHIEGVLAVVERRYEESLAGGDVLGLEDGGKTQKAFWHALEFCNDPVNRNIRHHWESYKKLLRETL
jgi:hypothetical protein